jgi:indolepyruvate ferredoxin oxidoreductase
VAIDGTYAIYIPGVGGTGVVTVNALLCYAALLEGKSLLNLDQTGLAQKGGAVLSNVILTDGTAVVSNKVGMGTANLYLVLDALGGVTPVNLDRTHPERTVAVVNLTPSPTGEMIRNNSVLFPTEAAIRRSIDQYTRHDRNVYIDAGPIAENLFGDHMATNIFLLGVAYQSGLLPLKAESIESAIALNGAAVQQNQQAFRYGRRYVYEPQAVLELALPSALQATTERAAALEHLRPKEAEAYQRLLERCRHLDAEAQRLLAIRVRELIDYQSVAYATDYVDFVLHVAAREAAVCSGHSELTHAVIRYLYKLMAYKDEYEVARLHLKQAWQHQLSSMFAQPRKVSYHFHPPLLRAMGLRRKLTLGPWFNQPLRILRALKILRGSVLDIFGYAHVRREEQQLISWYRQMIEQLLPHLEDSNHALAVVIANAPDGIRGYEDIKLRRIAETKDLVAQHLVRFTTPTRVEAISVLPPS